MTERVFAIAVVKTLQDAGHQALWAGGCVRDELLGLVPKDYDIATDARPEQVRQLFKRTLAIGASFGVVEVLGPRQEGQVLKVQVATFRSDGTYSDGRRPDQVVFSSACEDALRRDFTINGMFFDPVLGELKDYVNGQADLHARILRAIGDPVLRFQEDKLRLLRAVRMATRFELTIDPATAQAIETLAPQLPVVSAERIAEELRQLLVHPRRSRGLNLLMELGLAAIVLPELQRLKAAERWQHVLNVLDYLGPNPSFPLAMAALLLDFGEAKRDIAEDIASRLKLSNAEHNRISWLLQNYRALAVPRALRLSKLKTLLSQPGIHELLALERVGALANCMDIDHVEYCKRLLETWSPHEMQPPPLINGEDLKALGLTPGPLFKRILDRVYEAQLDGDITTCEEALELARKLIAGEKS
jgi:poly(A) polymerase